jgi:hypothetical protein
MTLEALVAADSLKGPRLEQVGRGEAFGLGVIDGVVRVQGRPAVIAGSGARLPESARGRDQPHRLRGNLSGHADHGRADYGVPQAGRVLIRLTRWATTAADGLPASRGR